MRKVTFSVTKNGVIEPSRFSIGHAGEHNATTIFITLPEEFCKKAEYFRLAIGGYQTEQLYATDNTLSYVVPQCVLISGTQFLQLEGYKHNNEGELVLVFKSDLASVDVLPSIDPYSETTDEVKCEVDGALGKLHYYVTHSDKLAAEIKGNTDECANILEQTKQTVSNKADKNKILDYITYTISDDEVTITGCNLNISGAHIIPDTIEGYPVTSIGLNAFYMCSSLTSIILPNSITAIGYYAFDDCKSLKNITIPNNVTFIDDYAFANCSSLTGAVIPNSVTSMGNGAFGACVALTNITIPKNITSIGEQTFYSCTALESIEIPDSVTSIGEETFYGCTKLADVYFGGTKEQWDKITIGEYNEPLFDATIHFANKYESYSRTEVDDITGDIETALDNIIALQNTIIGGEG